MADWPAARWTIRGPHDIADRLILQMGRLEREELRVVMLDTKNHVLRVATVYQGNVSASLVRVGELFRDAVRVNAAGVILVHNHPSGDPSPSPDDLHLTAEALAAGRLLDIQLLDHLVIGHDAYVSLRDRGVAFDRPGTAPGRATEALAAHRSRRVCRSPPNDRVYCPGRPARPGATRPIRHDLRRCPRCDDPPRPLASTKGIAAQMFDRILGFFSRDIGIDLGTANTLVHVRDRGIVMSEPSVVAIDAKTKRVLAVGAEAKRMVGRTPANIIAVRPLRDGVISDFDVTEQMIKYFVDKVHDRVGTIARPRMLLGIPSGVTEVEKRAVRDAALNAGARWAGLVEEPMAAAIGAGLPVSEPSGSLIVDIGGGTTEVAVISLGGIVVSRSIRIGGDEMDQDIVTFARREYNLFLGERTAEDIKIAIGSAYPGEWDAQRVALRGRDLLTGLPRASRSAPTRSARPSSRPSSRSSTRSRTRSRRRRPSSSPTSWTRASSSPAAARCWPASTGVSPRRPRCRSTSPMTR